MKASGRLSPPKKGGIISTKKFAVYVVFVSFEDGQRVVTKKMENGQ